MVKGRWNQRKEVFEKEISTQTAGKANKGRESHTGSQKISTQVNKISKKGRTTITE